jgi:predicted nucleic acid-binding protein
VWTNALDLRRHPRGAAVFIDANPFVYYFEPDPALGSACGALLQRVENGDIEGYTSAQVLNDVAHRLMTLEAMKLFGWPYAGIVHRLRKHPAEVQQLALHRVALQEIDLFNVRVLDVTRAFVSRAADFTRQFGLLASDALVVAMMESYRFTHLASNDGDFDRVPWITRYAPA